VDAVADGALDRSHTVAVPRSFRFAPATLDFILGPQAVPQDYLVEGGGWISLRPSHFHASSTDFTAIPGDLARVEARYGEIDMPAGILFGTADRIVAFAEHGAPMPDRIGGLDFEVVEGLGHMPHFVERRRTVAFIRRIAEHAFGS